MIRKIFVLLAIAWGQYISGQTEIKQAQEIAVSSHVNGTLLLPGEPEKPNLAIIIGSSGPTDRDGNQNFMQNNVLKKLAEGLTRNGIATFRYDKRIVKQIRRGNVDKSILFDDFVHDARTVVEYFKATDSYKAIFLIGHGQGSLVGMLASEEVNGFISISGAGKSLDQVIIEQIEKTAPMFTEDTKKALTYLKAGEITFDYPEALESIFDVDLQPFMSNWMQYDPAEVVRSLQMPVLIINGTKDLQVSTDEALLLHRAVPDSQLKLIDKMNHIMVTIEGDDLENSKSYNEPYRKISTELVNHIKSFILKE
ncbi:MAG: alpha/beta hydrolase [Flavobacteriaceae bacterium]|nr:lysophospholipase [Bacteroidia bacterium]NNF74193.1 alpha/beta hydrolase [Flavobacteriaceae bacterium]